MKNPMGKTRPDNDPYEVWESRDEWKWLVLKSYQLDRNKPYARAFCKVFSPFVPDGELGDVYWSDIVKNARRTYVDKKIEGGNQ